MKTHEIKFLGHDLILHASGALFWPKYSLLAVSDLHLEKGSFLASHGSPLPAYDTLETLEKISEVIDYFSPREIVCVGDSFHDKKAAERLSPAALEKLHCVVNFVKKWYWVVGNHDPKIAKSIPGKEVDSLEIENVRFIHIPAGGAGEICGHFHPAAKFEVNRKYIRGKTFVVNHELLIMPAMGAFTGGLDVKDEVMKKIVKGNSTLYFIFQNKIYPMKG